MKMHMRTFHIDKDKLREKQQKDKRINNIRNAAPALPEALEEYMRANKELLNCSYHDPVKLRAAREDFFDAEKDAVAAIKQARGE